MNGAERRAQVLRIAADEFASHGLFGASTETIARGAGITQAYIFRIFPTKKALFLELVRSAFDRISDGMCEAAAGQTGLEALSSMGAQYYDLLENRTNLLLQMQGFAACGDDDVREAVRTHFARMWTTVAETTGLDAVTVKSFLAYGMLLNSNAALDIEQVKEPWAEGAQTRIHAGLFEHITTATNQ